VIGHGSAWRPQRRGGSQRLGDRFAAVLVQALQTVPSGGELRPVGGDPFSRVEQSTLNQHGDEGGGSASAARGDHHQPVAGHRALVDDVDPAERSTTFVPPRKTVPAAASSPGSSKFRRNASATAPNHWPTPASTPATFRGSHLSVMSVPRTESEQERALVPHPRPARGDGRRPGTLWPRDLRHRRRDGRRVLSRSPCPAATVEGDGDHRRHRGAARRRSCG